MGKREKEREGKARKRENKMVTFNTFEHLYLYQKKGFPKKRERKKKCARVEGTGDDTT